MPKVSGMVLQTLSAGFLHDVCTCMYMYVCTMVIQYTVYCCCFILYFNVLLVLI